MSSQSRANVSFYEALSVKACSSGRNSSRSSSVTHRAAWSLVPKAHVGPIPACYTGPLRRSPRCGLGTGGTGHERSVTSGNVVSS